MKQITAKEIKESLKEFTESTGIVIDRVKWPLKKVKKKKGDES